MMPMPKPEDVLAAWSAAQHRIEAEFPNRGIEISILLVQDGTEDGEDTAICSAYVETGAALVAQCDHLMGHLVSEPTPPQWIAHAGGAYEIVDARFADLFHQDLQERFKNGDERVREVVVVTIASPDRLVVQSYSQPLLEPVGHTHVNDPALDSTVADLLRLMVTTLHGERTL
jgi:hypothetical protein